MKRGALHLVTDRLSAASAQQLRQLGEVHRHAAGLVAGQPVGAALRLIVEMEIVEQLAPPESCYSDGIGDGAPIMEQKLVCDDRLDIARRLYDALCGQYPDQFIILRDAQGRILARHDGPTVSTAAATGWRN